MNKKFVFEAIGESDSAAVLQLLAEAGLPSDGVIENLSDFTAARDEAAIIVAVAVIERYGKTGLLRSVAVASGWRNSGVGSQIVAFVLQKAQTAGVEEIVLLTATARDFFACRFGFSETVREDYDEILQSSTEWSLPRCSTAIVMRLDLKEKNFKKQ